MDIETRIVENLDYLLKSIRCEAAAVMIFTEQLMNAMQLRRGFPQDPVLHPLDVQFQKIYRLIEIREDTPDVD